QHDRATKLLADLAPEDRLGYAEAHHWVARRLLQPSAGQTIPRQDLQRAEIHLNRALRGTELPEQKRRDAHYLLGLVNHNPRFINSDREGMDEAIRYFEMAIASDSMPEQHMQLARLYLQRKDRFSAAGHLRTAVEELTPVVERDLDNIQARMALAEVLVLQE